MQENPQSGSPTMGGAEGLTDEAESFIVGQSLHKVGLGRFELPTSRLSDTRRALVGAGERWK